MIVLITPTGGRSHQFELCARWMKNQTYSGKVCWIIIDDCLPVTTGIVTSDFRKDWFIIKKYPRPVWEDGMNTQSRNLKIALDIIRTMPPDWIEAIFVIEDDDYYTPQYIEKMLTRLKGHNVAGETFSIYYNVKYGTYTVCRNNKHASLFQTCFTTDVLPAFTFCLDRKFIDVEFFRIVKNVNLFGGYNAEKLSVGMKGLPGRFGIGGGHKWRGAVDDAEFVKLKELLGEDYIYYANDYSK